MQHGGKWGQPEEIIRLDGVRSLAAGSHLSAVVSDEGQLHIWGKLLSEVRSAVYGTSAKTHTHDTGHLYRLLSVCCWNQLSPPQVLAGSGARMSCCKQIAAAKSLSCL